MSTRRLERIEYLIIAAIILAWTIWFIASLGHERRFIDDYGQPMLCNAPSGQICTAPPRQ